MCVVTIEETMETELPIESGRISNIHVSFISLIEDVFPLKDSVRERVTYVPFLQTGQVIPNLGSSKKEGLDTMG